jgi:hypothetical protein
MSEEVDLQHLAKMIDAALSSDNPSTRKALRNFLLVASITEAESDSYIKGPFTSLFDTLESLEKQMASLRQEVEMTRGTPDWYGSSRAYGQEKTDILELYRSLHTNKDGTGSI